MPIQTIHTFLVRPLKGEEDATSIVGTPVPLEGKLFDLLDSIYNRSDEECDIDITFSCADEASQQNDCRDLICSYLKTPTLINGRAIAQRLGANTDGRSGLGLLFLIAGKEGREHKIVISRFPTDNAVYVDENPRNLTVQFLERVFMKNKASYKAVAYKDTSLLGGFWNGRAIDKQLNSPGGEQSNYWIVDFLASDFTITAALGTRRLALALKDAAKKSELGLKQEITAAATLAQGLAGQRITIDEFCRRFHLSNQARTAIVRELKSARIAQDRFQFDLGEFRELIAFKAVELSNGGTLTAPSADFDNVFHKERINGEVRFTTQGNIINEKLKPTA